MSRKGHPYQTANLRKIFVNLQNKAEKPEIMRKTGDNERRFIRIKCLAHLTTNRLTQLDAPFDKPDKSYLKGCVTYNKKIWLFLVDGWSLIEFVVLGVLVFSELKCKFALEFKSLTGK